MLRLSGGGHERGTRLYGIVCDPNLTVNWREGQFEATDGRGSFEGRGALTQA